MGSNGEKIDTVVIISHGSSATSSPFIGDETTPVSECNLNNTKPIGTVYISSCYAGSENNYNVVSKSAEQYSQGLITEEKYAERTSNSFPGMLMYRHTNVGKVIASDGEIQYYPLKHKDGQSFFQSVKNFFEKSKGFVEFSRKKDGTVETKKWKGDIYNEK